MSVSIGTDPSKVDLSVTLGRLRLPNPVLVASGTFGYGREMAPFVDLARLGGILPKTITAVERQGNAPWRTVETSAGMLNAIGLDNDGADAFIAGHLPYLASCGAPIIVSIAGRSTEEFVSLARRLGELEESIRPAAVELNISCPNVSGGVDYGSDPARCEEVVSQCVAGTTLPVIAKLTPNVTSIAVMARAAEAGGADALSLINTVLGMAIDWRKRKPLLANTVGGLSGPAIKPIALRCVWQAAQAVQTPIIGVGGIATIDDAMEFFVAGASAVQLGTVNFYKPTASTDLLDALPGAIASLGAASLAEIVGTLQVTAPAVLSPPPPFSGEGLGEGAKPGERKKSRKRVPKNIRENAIDLRHNATYPEQAVWNALNSRQLAGLKFRRQHPIESFIVDFFCADQQLVIELDGESHEGREVQDRDRQARLESLGLRVLRFSNDDVLTNIDGVLESIYLATRTDGTEKPLP